jgi:hypothetical protein
MADKYSYKAAEVNTTDANPTSLFSDNQKSFALPVSTFRLPVQQGACYASSSGHPARYASTISTS